MTGKKHDQGKAQPDLILSDMSRAILAVAEVATFGVGKYTAGGWLHVDDAINRYRNAKQRHMLLGATELHDEESGLPHAAHEAWNALAVLELMLRDAQPTSSADRCKSLPSPCDWEAGEKRMDVVGQNGNDGAAYGVDDVPEGATHKVVYRLGLGWAFHKVSPNGLMFWDEFHLRWVPSAFKSLDDLRLRCGAVSEL